MNLLGRILVFVNLALSIAGVAWALGLYTQRVNWTPKSSPELGPSQLEARVNRIKELQAALTSSQIRFDALPQRLIGLENQRVLAQIWYLQDINHLQSLATKENPSFEVDAPGGQVATNPMTGLPMLKEAKDRNGGKMQAIDLYVKDIKARQGETVATMKTLDLRIKAAKDITDLLAGEKGLRQQLADERAKIAAIELAISLKDPKTGSVDGELRARLQSNLVEARLLNERLEELEKRVKELGGTGVAKNP